MTIQEAPQFLHLKQAASILCVHYETLRRGIAKGEYSEFEYYKPTKTARPRVTKESLERHIKRNTVKEI